MVTTNGMQMVNVINDEIMLDVYLSTVGPMFHIVSQVVLNAYIMWQFPRLLRPIGLLVVRTSDSEIGANVGPRSGYPLVLPLKQGNTFFSVLYKSNMYTGFRLKQVTGIYDRRTQYDGPIVIYISVVSIFVFGNRYNKSTTKHICDAIGHAYFNIQPITG